MSSAFGNRESSGIWCNVSAGKITRKAEPGAKGSVAVKKIDKNGAAVLDENGQEQFYHQFQSDTVTGRIVKLRRDVDKFQDVEIPKLIITVHHKEDGLINIQVKQGSRYWMALMNSLGNVDVMQEVTFEPWDYVKKADGKRTTGLGLKQNGQAVPWKYTKDSTDGPPKLETVKLQDGTEYLENGKPKFYWAPIINWYNDNVLAHVNAKVTDAVAMFPVAGVAIAKDEENAGALDIAGGEGVGASELADNFTHLPDVDDDDSLPF